MSYMQRPVGHSPPPFLYHSRDHVLEKENPSRFHQPQPPVSARHIEPGPSSSSRPSPSVPSEVYTDTLAMPPPSSIHAAKKRKLVPVSVKAGAFESNAPGSSPEPSDTSHDPQDTEYDPSPGPTRSKRLPVPTGNKPTTSRTGKPLSREALRKANHSLIERRRREKINAALADLRAMVPGLGDEGAKGGEFKLEVLERTVAHMRELQAKVDRLERGQPQPDNHEGYETSEHTSSTYQQSDSPILADAARSRNIDGQPKLETDDPNETESEAGLPPALTYANRPTRQTHRAQGPDSQASSSSSSSQKHRAGPPASLVSHATGSSGSASPSHPSLAALLSSAPPPAPSSRPPPPPQASNPTLYLPFPTPSPTSPFLSYSSSTSASTSGPMEPSPFLAPLQGMGMSLFGGALNLDNSGAMSPVDVLGNANGAKKELHSGPHTQGEEEQAANVLLAFSSPDVMRPTIMGMTPLHSTRSNSNGSGDGKERPKVGNTLERKRNSNELNGEDFVLDGGSRVKEWSARDILQGEIHSPRLEGRVEQVGGAVRGKTARDILRM